MTGLCAERLRIWKCRLEDSGYRTFLEELWSLGFLPPLTAWSVVAQRRLQVQPWEVKDSSSPRFPSSSLTSLRPLVCLYHTSNKAKVNFLRSIFA
jgi:hypothetical protein